MKKRMIIGGAAALLIVLLLIPRKSATHDISSIDFKGDAKQCNIKYVDNGSTTSWVVNTSKAGELITHLSSRDNKDPLDRHDEKVGVGVRSYTAAIPLSDVVSINGLLYVGEDIYTCNVSAQS